MVRSENDEAIRVGRLWRQTRVQEEQLENVDLNFEVCQTQWLRLPPETRESGAQD